MADALRKRNNPATSISTTEGGIQPTTLTMSPSSSSPSHCLIRKGRGFLTEQKEILCNLLLDRCLPNGSLETNACQAVANQVQSTESIVKKVWASMLRSVVETGAIDPCLSTKRRRAPIDIPTAYACMAEALRRRNNAATAAFSTRPVAGTVAFALPPTSTLTAASSRNDQRVASVAASAIATVSRQPLQSALEIESLSSLSTQTRGSAPVSRSSPSWNPTSPAVLPRRDLDAAWYPQNLYM
jgi:hypothetical protein